MNGNIQINVHEIYKYSRYSITFINGLWSNVYMLLGNSLISQISYGTIYGGKDK